MFEVGDGMHVFLTGATGFIGQTLSRALRQRGWQVTALIRRPDSPQAQALTRLGVRCVSGDVTSYTSVVTAVGDAELVIHSAGHYEYGVDTAGRQQMQAVNVLGTANVLSAARELEVPRTIYVSSVVAYGDSGQQARDETFVRQAPYTTYYEKTKSEAHETALRYQQEGRPLIIVCPNGVVGVNDHSAWGYTLRLYLSGLKPPLSWSPESIFSLVEVGDVVQGVLLAAEKGRVGETYFLCGEPLTFKAHLDLWTLRPGRFKVRSCLPASVIAPLFALAEPLQRRLGLPAFISRETVRAGSVNLFYVSDKAEHELGWQHKTAEAMWLSTVDGELELLAKRTERDLVSRLKPVEL